MSDRGARIRARLIRCYLQCIHSRSSKCISTAQARRIRWARAGALRDCALVVVPCAFSGLVGEHFSWQESQLFLTAQEIGAYVDVQISWQARTLEIVVIFNTLSFRGRCSESRLLGHVARVEEVSSETAFWILVAICSVKLESVGAR